MVSNLYENQPAPMMVILHPATAEMAAHLRILIDSFIAPGIDADPGAPGIGGAFGVVALDSIDYELVMGIMERYYRPAEGGDTRLTNSEAEPPSIPRALP